MSKPEEQQDIVLEVSALRFQIGSNQKSVDVKAASAELLNKIKENNMLVFYKSTCEELSWKLDSKLVTEMEAAIKKQLTDLDAELKDAQENHGEIEVMEVQQKIARTYAASDTKEKAIEAFREIQELKSLSSGQKIDVVLELIRLGFYWGDNELVKTNILEADRLLEIGGDWDRRNRLKVYKALFSMISRDFQAAAENFLSAVATFTSYELCSYNTFVFYTIVTSIVALDRVDFKKKIIDAPEILSVIHENPAGEEFLNSIYECRYKDFLVSLTKIYKQLSTDRYVSVHRDWFVREMRVLAYKQFLESYKSVTMKSMAKSFGVTESFLDKELAHFIASLRLNAKIDKNSGVIETNRPLHSNAQYQAVIKQGDVLLNRVQMLSRAVNV